MAYILLFFIFYTSAIFYFNNNKIFINLTYSNYYSDLFKSELLTSNYSADYYNNLLYVIKKNSTLVPNDLIIFATNFENTNNIYYSQELYYIAYLDLLKNLII